MKVLNLTVEKKPFLLQQLEALEEHGVEGDLVTVPGERIIGEEEVQRHSVFDYVKFYPKVLRHSLNEYDLVHAHFGLTAPFAFAQPHRPIVTSLWDWDLYGEYGWVSRRFANWSDAVIVRNEEMGAELDQEAHVVERGVNMEKFSPMDQREAQDQVGWDPDVHHVLFPYSPSREKKNYPLAKKLVTKVEEKTNEKVILHTVYNEPHEKIPIYMNAADVLLITSKSEGSPNTVKEALSCELPVVSTNVGDVDSLIEGVDYSYSCETENDLEKGLIDALSSNNVDIGGRESIKELTWDNTAISIIDIYNSVLQ